MEKLPEDNLKDINEKEKQNNNENNLKKEEDNLKNEEKDKNSNKDESNIENYIPNYIERYGKEIGLPNLKMNGDKENYVVSLCFSGIINVDIVYNEKNNTCFLASPICSVPNNDYENFYEQLLISNNTYNENGGLILGIEEDENRVVLSYTFIANTFSYSLFKIVLNNFVNIVEKNMLKFEEF